MSILVLQNPDMLRRQYRREPICTLSDACAFYFLNVNAQLMSIPEVLRRWEGCRYLLPIIGSNLLPNNDAVVKRTGCNQGAKFWMRPCDLPHWPLMANQLRRWGQHIPRQVKHLPDRLSQITKSKAMQTPLYL